MVAAVDFVIIIRLLKITIMSNRIALQLA